MAYYVNISDFQARTDDIDGIIPSDLSAETKLSNGLDLQTMRNNAEQNLKEFDGAFKTAAENEVGYNADAAQGIANAMAQASSSAAKSLSDLSEASAEVAKVMIAQFNAVWNAVKGQMIDPNSVSGASGAATMVSPEGQKIDRDVLKEIAQGDIININGAEYKVGD